MLKRKLLWRLGLAFALALTFGVGRASADFNLDTSNLGSGFAGPFVSVSESLSGQTATFEFKSLVAPTGTAYTYWLTDGGSAALNINSSSFTEAFVTASPNPTGFKDFSSGNDDGFGSFNLKLNLDSSGPTSRNTDITFTVTNTDLLHPWLTLADVLIANKNGAVAAAHVGALAPGDTDFTKTGFVAGSGGGPNPPMNTPEPSTLAIAGLGALGFMGYRLRRRSAG